MASANEIVEKVKDRLPQAHVIVSNAPKGFRVVIAEPGHRTIEATLEPHMIDTGVHLLAMWRKESDRTQ